MEITRKEDNGSIILNIKGEIDGTNVDEFEKSLKESVSQSQNVVLDLTGLVYISSTVLRVFLMYQKQMKAKGGVMVIKNVGNDVMDIFNVTGFVKLLNIEK
ncbi:MAG: STAS domain-containing protein [Lachnospiraceae bacterium]|nr:STAS domain-containing protein [Lachnospiraceae bacterium]